MGLIVLYHFLNFCQCVCLGIKRSTKLQISKYTPKGDISFLKNSFSRTTTNYSLDYNVVYTYFVMSQK